VSFDSAPINSLVLELWIRTNFHIGPVVAEFEQGLVSFLKQRHIAFNFQIMKFIHEVMGQVISVFS
jgi:hypothetical protein